jgi:hypothetical protein
VTNHEPLPLRFDGLSYRFRLDPADGGDVDLDVRGTQATALSLARPGEQRVVVPVQLRDAKLGKALWKFVARAKKPTGASTARSAPRSPTRWRAAPSIPTSRPRARWPTSNRC